MSTGQPVTERGRAGSASLDRLERGRAPAAPHDISVQPEPFMRVLNSAQMREADRCTIEEIGVPSIVLMENAGRAVVAAIEATFEDAWALRIAVLAGRGNNGGDGFVIARTLVQRGTDVTVFVLGSTADVRGDARINLEILARLGLTPVEIANEQDWELHSSQLAQRDLIVDAMFGTGLRQPLSGMLQTVVADLNGLGVPIVAVDLPSGISADTHELIGDAVEATLTVTLGAPKLPLVLPPAETHCGELVIADIGIPEQVIEELEGPRVRILTREVMRDLVAPRSSDTHKGDYGRVLIVAGSVGKTGAAHLAAMGALKSGAGLVTVATSRTALPIVAAMAPEYMTLPLPDTVDGTIAAAAAEDVLAFAADVCAVGPGLGQGPEVARFMSELLARSGIPLVLDADALNAFAGRAESLRGRDGLDVIITPHPGELARLMGVSAADVQKNRIDAARSFATSHHVHVILKGHRTLVAAPDGAVSINLTGNPGMATGGSGDVLTGMVAAWFAQLLDADAAACLAVHLHGAAGDLAEADEGEQALTASDIIAHVGDAVMELTARQRRVGASES